MNPDNELVEFDIDAWLKPVNVSRKQLRSIYDWSEKNGSKDTYKNVYSCKNGHRIVTVDQTDHDPIDRLACPTCQQEMRSWMYCCDQALKPSHRFYEPKPGVATPGDQHIEQQQFVVGDKRIIFFGPIIANEPIEVTAKAIKAKLKQSTFKVN